jgi:hypothetical protein
MQISEKIRPISFRNDYTGKILSISKRTYCWTFEHLDHVHELRLTIYLMSQKFKVDLDSRVVDMGYRPLVGKLRYTTNVHDLNLRIAEGNHTFDLYINDQRFVPGSQIIVVDSSRTHYLQLATVASMERQHSQSLMESPSKVIFGTEELIEADRLLRANTDTTNSHVVGHVNGLGSQPRGPGSQSPGRQRRRTNSRDFLKSPLNQKITTVKQQLIEGRTQDSKPLPPLPPLPQRVTPSTVPNYFDTKVDSWFFDVSDSPKPISDLRGTLLMGEPHEYEARMEIYMPIGLDDRSLEFGQVVKLIY